MSLATSLHDKLGAKKIVIMDRGTGTEISRRGVACGATIIGGCCGTTPEHIRTLTASNLSDTR